MATATKSLRTPPEQLLTPKQVSKLLGVAEQTLAHWRTTRRVNLPFLPISTRCVRYRETDVQKFQEQLLTGSLGS